MSANFRHIVHGINLVRNPTTQVTVEGDLDYATDTGQFFVRDAEGTSALVTETGTQTLTNKTLIDPIISEIINSGTLTLPTSTDTLVGRSTTDTLTNKTIAASSNTISGLSNSNLSGSAAITNANLASMATHTIKGNSTGGSALPSDLSGTAVTALLDNFIGDSGSGGTKGLVPAPAAGDAAANKFLKADGTFSIVSGAGIVSIGTIDSQTASTNGAVISGTSLVMQSASATRPGLVNNTTQTMSGAKIFSTSISTGTIVDNSNGLTVSASSNKDLQILTSGTGRLQLKGSNGVDFQQQGSTPSGVPSGYDTFYFKTDDLPYYQTNAGVEIPFIPALPVVSSSCSSFSTSSGTPIDVTNLSVTVTNHNANAVWDISLKSDGTGNESVFRADIGGASVVVQGYITLLRNNLEIARYVVGGEGSNFYNSIPSSSIRMTDINPPTGSNTYKIQAFQTNNGGGGTVTVANAKLQAYSIRF